MILFHGTNTDIEKIDLSRSLNHKDFGKGFYLTDSRETAIRMATKKARLFGGKAILIIYEFDEAALHSDLKVKVFPEKATVEWFLFVDANRDRENQLPIHDYDIIIARIYTQQKKLQKVFKTSFLISNIISGRRKPCAISRNQKCKYYDTSKSSSNSDLFDRLCFE